ncbi:MAG: nickel pincer cofactor biosynthesis protein LarC [Planctomycetaceae bacterium]
MKIALLDPVGGIAGDMLVGALVDAGASFEAIKRALKSLKLGGYVLSRRKVMRGGIRATKFTVRPRREEQEHRGLAQILKILRKSTLSPAVREKAEAAFRVLAAAEATVHGCTVEEVHFHEVGAIDAICDVVGAAAALAELEVERLFCNPLPLSSGSVETEHGRMPVPAPATMELLKGRATFASGLVGELVTPTGAACIAAWAEKGAPPPFTPVGIGYGAGDRDPGSHPNVCRAVVGEASDAAADEELFELVSDMDDATPQVLAHLLERLLAVGALDATLQPLIMKKGRPGTRATALVRRSSIAAVEEVLFREGTTLGVRRRRVERTILARRIMKVNTRYGSVRLKIGEYRGKVVHVAPEYEDCRALAETNRVPLPEIFREAMARWEG